MRSGGQPGSGVWALDRVSAWLDKILLLRHLSETWPWNLEAGFQFPVTGILSLDPNPCKQETGNWKPDTFSNSRFLSRYSALFSMLFLPTPGHGQGPVAVDGDDPDDEHRQSCDDGTHVHADACSVEQQVDDASDNACSGVDLLLQDERNVIGEHVPYKPASSGGHHAGHYRNDETGLEFKGLARSDNKEGGQTQCVEIEQWSMEKIQCMMEEEYRQGETYGDDKIVLILEAEWRDISQEDIPQGPATGGSDQAQDDDPEQIHAPLYTCQSTGNGKGSRSEKIESIKETHNTDSNTNSDGQETR